MGKFLIGGVIGLVLGAVGAFMSLGAAVGAGAGAGIAVGLSAGVCTMARSAQDLGVMTAEQVDEVLANAVRLFDETAEIQDDTEIVGSAAQCDEALARLKGVVE